jgi:hypothetical protein
MTRMPIVNFTVASAWAAAWVLLSCGTSLAQTPAEPTPAEPTPADQAPMQSPMVSVCLYALGDAPVRSAIRLQGKELEAAKREEQMAWDEAFPGKPLPKSTEPIMNTEAVNPLEIPPSPILIDIDKAKDTRKLINLDHMGKTSVVIKRTPLLTLQRVFNPPVETPGPPQFSKLTDIPIPPTVDELLVFIIKPPDTYEWTKAVFHTIDMSPKKHGANTLLIVNLSSFPVRAEILPKSPDEKIRPFSANLAPDAIASKITEDPTGERIALFANDGTKPFAARITTPRDRNREIIVIYNKMSGFRDNLHSVPGMQSFSLPIKAMLPVSTKLEQNVR